MNEVNNVHGLSEYELIIDVMVNGSDALHKTTGPWLDTRNIHITKCLIGKLCMNAS